LTTRRITTPGGVQWSVRRRWLPHREGKGVVRRFRNHSTPEATDHIAEVPIEFGDGVAGLVIGVVIFVFALVALAWGWPLVLIGVDLVWLLLIGVIGLAGRVVLRRPWRVEAVSAFERRNWFVKGYRAAGERRDEIVRQFVHGQNPIGDSATPMQH
jgi:hypothetical protein